MAKINKEEEARRSGMAYALKIITEAMSSGSTEAEAIEKLKTELRYRNITKAPLMVPQTEVERFCQEVKNNCVTTFKVMTMLVLHDEFGFGQKRLEQFMERFMLKTDCIVGDYATWKDYQDILMDECKIKIDMADEFYNLNRGEKVG